MCFDFFFLSTYDFTNEVISSWWSSYFFIMNYAKAYRGSEVWLLITAFKEH